MTKKFRKDFQDLTGKTFTYITVQELHKRANGRGTKMLWKCRCKCGAIIICSTSVLKFGHSKSCGCFQKEMASVHNKTHGISGSRLFHIFSNMISRCNNPRTSEYHRYGGRGIKICKQWRENPSSFFQWSMENGYKENLTIERKDNDGNYEPSNCEWATLYDQQCNRSNNIYLTIKGEIFTASQAGRKFNMCEATIRWRLKNGFNDEQAVNIQQHPRALPNRLTTSPRQYIPLCLRMLP